MTLQHLIVKMSRGFLSLVFDGAAWQGAYLNEVEAGKRNPAIKNLIKISQGLGVLLSYLFQDVDRPA